MMFTTPPKTMGGQRAPFKTESETQAYTKVDTTCTALVPVGYVLI